MEEIIEWLKLEINVFVGWWWCWWWWGFNVTDSLQNTLVIINASVRYKQPLTSFLLLFTWSVHLIWREDNYPARTWTGGIERITWVDQWNEFLNGLIDGTFATLIITLELILFVSTKTISICHWIKFKLPLIGLKWLLLDKKILFFSVQ